MHRVAQLEALLCVAALLGCASAPRVVPRIGETRVFAQTDRFAPASSGVLATENPEFDEPALESLRGVLEQAIGWRGLTLATDDEADWLVSCAFRKRLIWKGDITREPISEPWKPQSTRVLGPNTTQAPPHGAQPDPNAPRIEPWIETIVELRLRSRRTGTIGWSAERIWGRNRTELPEDELKDTIQLLLERVRFQGDAAPKAAAEAR